jgi:Putative ATP-dependent Lon protease
MLADFHRRQSKNAGTRGGICFAARWVRTWLRVARRKGSHWPHGHLLLPVIAVRRAPEWHSQTSASSRGPEFFTNQYGLIVDHLAEWVREMRKRNSGDAINKYYKLGRDLNQRDTIAVKHTVSGLLKLLYPNGRI